MPIERIASLLKKTIGVEPAILGSDTISRAVRERMAVLKLEDAEKYFYLLQRSEGELQDLIEEVVVPETWFFRDWEPFVFLARFAASEWLPARADDVLRLLSIPCSTGEEPYSIAMALLDAGMTPRQFQIDAADISERALIGARYAVYGSNSFRGQNLGFRSHYFEIEGERHRLSTTVTSAVRFFRGNLIDGSFCRQQKPYHVIFCRNLLIYFEAAARALALRALGRLLAKPGLLFVGHAETMLAASQQLAEVAHPQAFAFKMKEDGAVVRAVEAPAWNHLPEARENSAGARRSFQMAAPDEGPGGCCSAPQPAPQRQQENVLEAATRLADSGNLKSAESLCEQYLAENGANAQAYFLLGLLREACGHRDQAEEFYTKALYLDPTHYEALIHLALLTKPRDAAAAALLEQRARRAQNLQRELIHV